MMRLGGLVTSPTPGSVDGVTKAGVGTDMKPPPHHPVEPRPLPMGKKRRDRDDVKNLPPLEFR